MKKDLFFSLNQTINKNESTLIIFGYSHSNYKSQSLYSLANVIFLLKYNEIYLPVACRYLVFLTK